MGCSRSSHQRDQWVSQRGDWDREEVVWSQVWHQAQSGSYESFWLLCNPHSWWSFSCWENGTPDPPAWTWGEIPPVRQYCRWGWGQPRCLWDATAHFWHDKWQAFYSVTRHAILLGDEQQRRLRSATGHVIQLWVIFYLLTRNGCRILALIKVFNILFSIIIN